MAREIFMPKGYFKPMNGKRYGKLIVMSRGPNSEEENRVQWWVHCDACLGTFLKKTKEMERHKSFKCKMCEYKYEFKK